MRKLDIKWLPYMGAIVQAGLFAIAGYHYFDLGAWGALAGFGVGMLVNFSMAIASSRISDIAKSRKPLAYAALLLLFCVSPAVIVSSLGFTLANLFWSLAADLSIMLTGAIAGKSLVAHGEPEKPAAKRTKPAKKPVEPAPEPEKPAFICSVAGCSAKPFASQSALNAHQRKHKRIIGYTASFEPVIESNKKV